MQPLPAHPREDLDETLVAEALSLSRGAKIRFGHDVLDLDGVVTGETLPVDADAGSVTWSYRPPDRVTGQTTEVAAVRRRAEMVLVGDVSVNLHARRVRLWSEMLLSDGAWARFHDGVFAATNPATVDDGVLIRRTLRLADKSYDWANTFLDEPVELDGTEVGVDWVKASLTAEFDETLFAIPTSAATVGEPRLFEAGTSWLDVYAKVLEAVGYDQLHADENGYPASRPLADLASQGVEHTYGAGEGKILRAGQVEPLLPTLPNVVRFSARQGPSLGNTEGDGLYTVRNESVGPASIDARGREVVVTVEVDADDQATLEAVAEAEKQRYFAGGGVRFQGQVGFNPRHSDRDVVSFDLPRLGMEGGEWLVTEWTQPRRRAVDPSAVLYQITAEQRV